MSQSTKKSQLRSADSELEFTDGTTTSRYGMARRFGTLRHPFGLLVEVVAKCQIGARKPSGRRPRDHVPAVSERAYA